MTVFVCLLHEASRIVSHQLTDMDEFCHDLISLFAIAPYLVIGSGSLAKLARLVINWGIGLAAAMQTHNRTEGTELEPADQQLFRIGILQQRRYGNRRCRLSTTECRKVPYGFRHRSAYGSPHKLT